MSELNQEALDILQEECGEVVQAVSKFRRWGPDSHYPPDGPSNLENIQREVWDVVILAELAGLKILPPPDYVIYKHEKLSKFSNLIDTEAPPE